jgi:IS605 OrfB family transposase
VARALTNYADFRSGKRAGRRVGFPRFKAVLSTGECVPNPRHLGRSLARLRSAGRTLSRRAGPNRDTRTPPSKRWERARAEVSRLHARVANQRRDGLHKLTTHLAGTYGTVVVEDLHVAGMLRNRPLARHLADAGFGEIRRQLGYKICWNGGSLIVADRWFASSKTCSACQTVKHKLSLAVRICVCDACGLTLDRDLNAAINLKYYVARSGWETVNGRGADQRTGPSSAGGCETSTPHHHGGQDGDRPLVTASSE